MFKQHAIWVTIFGRLQQVYHLYYDLKESFTWQSFGVVCERGVFICRQTIVINQHEIKGFPLSFLYNFVSPDGLDIVSIALSSNSFKQCLNALRQRSIHAQYYTCYIPCDKCMYGTTGCKFSHILQDIALLLPEQPFVRLT